MKECIKRWWKTKKNVFLKDQFAKALRIISSIEQNIIKRFRETRDISVCEGQGWRPLCSGPQTTLHQPDCMNDIIKWAQEYFQKPLLVNTIRCAICRCQLKLHHTETKLYLLMVHLVDKSVKCPSWNICYLIHYLLWIKYWLMWFGSILVLILFKFKNVPTFPEFRL